MTICKFYISKTHNKSPEVVFKPNHNQNKKNKNNKHTLHSFPAINLAAKYYTKKQENSQLQSQNRNYQTQNITSTKTLTLKSSSSVPIFEQVTLVNQSDAHFCHPLPAYEKKKKESSF